MEYEEKMETLRKILAESSIPELLEDLSVIFRDENLFELARKILKLAE